MTIRRRHTRKGRPVRRSRPFTTAKFRRKHPVQTDIGRSISKVAQWPEETVHMAKGGKRKRL
jgi:hypothetical protein